MPTFEVTYDVRGEIRTALVEAAIPAEAARLFAESEQARAEGAVVLCVVRQ
jgi:hypothetical protein